MNVTALKFDIHKLHGRKETELSLSRYFPRGTNYFYGYPSGDASGFFNRVPPTVEELVSARPLVCAGSGVNVITFADTMRADVHHMIEHQFGSPRVNKRQTRVLPKRINEKMIGSNRNDQVKNSLKQLVLPGTLVMAQPFLDDDMKHLYQISPKLTNWLNDKKHMESFIPTSCCLPGLPALKTVGNFMRASNNSKRPVLLK